VQQRFIRTSGTRRRRRGSHEGMKTLLVSSEGATKYDSVRLSYFLALAL
jgi:hypothetical protein